MLQVEVDGKLYEVGFTYEAGSVYEIGKYYTEEEINSMVARWGTPRDVVACEIVEGADGDWDNVSVGVAVRRPDETSNRALGRKIALTRALRSHNENVRTAIWQEYWKLVNQETQNRQNMQEVLDAMFINRSVSAKTKKAADNLLETRDDKWLKMIRNTNLDNSPVSLSAADEAGTDFCVDYLEKLGYSVVLNPIG